MTTVKKYGLTVHTGHWKDIWQLLTILCTIFFCNWHIWLNWTVV